MKDNSTSAFVKVSLSVPRGLLEFLEKMQYMTGKTPKAYLEAGLTKELECILGNLDTSMFDSKLIRARYGEGSKLLAGE